MRFWKCKRGASAVEFALVAPLLLLMFFGIIEYGRLFWTQHVLNETAIATARCMAVPQVECAQDGVVDLERIASFAHNSARSLGVHVELADVEPEPVTQCHGLAGFSAVTLTSEFSSPLTGLVMGFSSGPRVSASACFPNFSS